MDDNAFLEKLASTATPATDATERLGMLGKRAAGLYMSKEAESLTEAVRSVVSSEEGLGDEQVRRITEIANQATWKELFVNQGDRNVEFEPGDSSRVLDTLTTKPQTALGNPVLDYMEDPPGEEPPDLDLKQLFGVKEDPTLPSFDPAREVFVEREKVAAAADVARHGIDLLRPELEASAERFYGLVKQAHLAEGAGFLQIARAVGMVTEEDFAQRVMTTAGQRLVAEGVAINELAEKVKLAEAVVVDVEHPLLVEAVRFEKLAGAYVRATKAAKALDEQETLATDSLRETLRAS